MLRDLKVASSSLARSYEFSFEFSILIIFKSRSKLHKYKVPQQMRFLRQALILSWCLQSKVLHIASTDSRGASMESGNRHNASKAKFLLMFT